jgi:hypothetical protein
LEQDWIELADMGQVVGFCKCGDKAPGAVKCGEI